MVFRILACLLALLVIHLCVTFVVMFISVRGLPLSLVELLLSAFVVYRYRSSILYLSNYLRHIYYTSQVTPRSVMLLYVILPMLGFFAAYWTTMMVQKTVWHFFGEFLTQVGA
jgi:hypothetical protein